jgi:hypothetical protein
MDRGDSYKSLYLNGKLFEITATQHALLASFVNKTTFGDPNFDSDPLLSAKIYTSFLGGIGIERAKEAQDDQRYWIGSLDTLRPFQTSLLPRCAQIEHSVGIAPLGDLDGSVYFGTATTLHSYNETTGALSASLGTLVDPPVYRAWNYKGKLYIPQSDGYQTWDGTTVAAQNTTVKAICFAEWDDKLYALCSDFKLYRTQDGASWTLMATLSDSLVLRRLVLYMDGAANDTLYIITTTGIYAWDEENSRVVTTRLGHLPPHPDNGYGACMWRQGEDLFLSAGLDIYRWTISGVAPFSGPSADQGLPQEYRGRIIDLIPEHSGMYALIQGVTGPGEVFEPDSLFDVGHITEGEIDTTISQGSNSVLIWNGRGWHPVSLPTVTGTPSWFHISGANDNYRLWWSVDNILCTVQLGRPILNPRQRIIAGQGDFELTGQLTTSKFDGNMFMYDKLSSHLEIHLDYFEVNTHQFIMEYRTESSDWETISFDFAQGLNLIPLDVVDQDDGTQFSEGVIWRWVQFRFTMSTTDSTTTPIMESLSNKFIRIPLKQRSFTFQIPFQGDYHGNRTTEEAIADLEEMIVSKRYIRMQTSSLPDQSYRVYISQASGAGLSGNDPRGYVSLTLAQIVLTNYSGEPRFG